MTFEFVKEKLTENKIPCRLKEVDNGELIIECGSGYPEELFFKIQNVIPDFKGSVCSSERGHNIINSALICDGPIGGMEYSI